MIVVKLGGTNGSGKTSIARALMEMMGQSIARHHGGKIQAYSGKVEGRVWAILGNYENVCGGMDTISDKNIRLAMVRHWAENAHVDVVFFEGLITGKTYGAFGAMSEEPQHIGKWLYAFMDTPFEECVARVTQRRQAKGNEAPFDAERTMRPTYKAVNSVALRAATVGHTVYKVPYQLTPAQAASSLVIAAHALINK